MAAYPGVPFPGSVSPQPMMAQMAQQQYSPSPAAGQAQITPGTITYTTSVDESGRVMYNPFRAVPASYQTNAGIVNGIQWIPAEATTVLPVGAQPANPDFSAAWNRGYVNKEDERALKDWQRDEDKRRKREEKESAKRVAQWEKDRRDREKAEERELRKAREKDAQFNNINRTRKKSVSFDPISGPPTGYMPSQTGSVYGGTSSARSTSPMPGGYPNTGSAYSGGVRSTSPIPGYNNSAGGTVYSGGMRSTSPIPGYNPGAAGQVYGGRSTSPIPGYNPGAAGQVYGGPDRRSTSPIPGYNPGAPGSAYAGGYPSGFERERRLSSSVAPDLDRRFEAMGISNPSSGAYGVTRKVSMSDMDKRRSATYPSAVGGTYPTGYPNATGAPAGYPATGGYGGSSPYSTSTYPTSPSQYGSGVGSQQYSGAYPSSPNRPEPNLPGSTAGGYPSSAYPSSPGRRGTGGFYPPSPQPGDAFGRPSRPPSPYSTVGRGGVYPPGHVMEGQPIRSRASSPNPMGMNVFPGGPSPNMRGGSLVNFPGDVPVAPPEGFSRPPNSAQPYTPFDPMRILDMDEMDLLPPPRMPVVLGPHDVYPEDWNRLMQDLTLAWARKLPVPDAIRTGRIPKRSSVVSEIVDSWNYGFFFPRGVEVVLYKGRERRTGPNAGVIDHLPEFELDEDDLTSSDGSSSATDSSLDERYQYGEHGGVYGRQMDPQLIALREQKRRRRDKKAEKKRRALEKKLRKKAKEREKKYSLYITSVDPRAVTNNFPGGHVQF